MAKKRPLVLRPYVDRLDERCLLSTAPTGLSPLQLTEAYGLNNLKSSTGTTLTGAGQTIALIEAYTNPNLTQEIAGFDKQFGLTALNVSSTIGGSNGPTLTQVNLAAGRSASQNNNAGWAEEEALDVEVAHSIAPGANILVVEAASPTTASLMAAVVFAENQKGVSVVSMSWGESEVKSDETNYDADFNKSGITFVASSGDSGPNSGPEWPATSPYVVGVGGTTLNISTTGGTTTYVGESAWNNAYGGSSGGLSAFETEPAFQESVQSTGKRSSPDIAFDADPNTGVSVYYIAPTIQNPTATSGTWLQVGGTSLGAPAVAAIIALADQDLALSRLASVDSTQVLTDLFTVAAVSPGDFHAIAPTGLILGAGFGFGGKFSGAQSTADEYTGLGSPNGSSFFTGFVDKAEGLTVPANAGTSLSTFNGETVPATGKTTGGTTTGGGPAGGSTTGGQSGSRGGAPAGGQGGGQTGGWWWWFGWSPFTRGGAGAVGGAFGPASPSGAGSTNVGSGSSLATVAPVQSKPTTAPVFNVGVHPWGPSPIGSSAGVAGAVGLLTPVVAPNPAALLPFQNVPDIGGAIDDTIEWLANHSPTFF